MTAFALSAISRARPRDNDSLDDDAELEQLAAYISPKQLGRLIGKYLSRVKYWSSDRLPIFQWVVEASSKPFSVEKRRKYRVLYESFRLSCEEMGLDWNKALVAVIAKVLLMKKDDIKMEVAA